MVDLVLLTYFLQMIAYCFVGPTETSVELSLTFSINMNLFRANKLTETKQLYFSANLLPTMPRLNYFNYLVSQLSRSMRSILVSHPLWEDQEKRALSRLKNVFGRKCRVEWELRLEEHPSSKKRDPPRFSMAHRHGH